VSVSGTTSVSGNVSVSGTASSSSVTMPSTTLSTTSGSGSNVPVYVGFVKLIRIR
jgi:UDP-N-acetylglucosamine enolpyruvyl transferase